MQKILISFFNDDQDEMFNYYDNRMTRRLSTLKKYSIRNEKILFKILKFAKGLYESSQFEEALHKFAKSSTLTSKNRGNTMTVLGTMESNRYRE